MNMQDLFTQAVQGVIHQGGPSVDDNGLCQYHAPNGRKCAVGHVIPVNVYIKEMEGKDIIGVLRHCPGSIRCETTTLDMLYDLQRAHDDLAEYAVRSSTESEADFVKRFREAAEQVANKYGLEMPE